MIPAGDFSKVEALVAVDNPGLRQGLREALRRIGCKQIVEAVNGLQVQRALAENAFDLMVMVSEMENLFLGELVRDLRHNRLGRHPFPLVVMLSTMAEFDYVRRLVDCGPDDVLLMPVAPDSMLSRMRTLVLARKPFVVTHDYVGPDRRKNHRPSVGGESAPMLEVPNPVAAKVYRIDETGLERDILQVRQRLNLLKIERHGVQISWLEKQLLQLFSAQQPDERLIRLHSLHLADIAEDVLARSAAWQDKALEQACRQMQDVAHRVGDAGRAAMGPLLDELSQGCRAAAAEIARCMARVGSGWMPPERAALPEAGG
ncbi:regulator of RpoS [mine drainage metagenome]|uniref:Regulator of RpoS n=1 Tax=mine drainage metagenome TaxID=410659 RepID=A0A1J5S2C2_9ZZZZ